MSLAYFQTNNKDISLLQTSWSQQINPIINNAANQSIILQDIQLVSGMNPPINHRLGRKLQGWKVIMQNAQASIWDSQQTNTMPQLTLLLNSDAPVTISLEVF